MDEESNKTVLSDKASESSDCFQNKDETKTSDNDSIFDKISLSQSNVIRDWNLLTNNEDNSNLTMNKDYFFALSSSQDQDKDNCGRRMKEFTSSLQSWSFSLPFSANLPNLPSNPLPQLRQSLPNIRGYLSSNLNFPNHSTAIPSLSLPSMIPSFPVYSAMSSLSCQSINRKKSWKEITECVHKIQCKLFKVSNRVPFAFNFRSLLDANGVEIGTRVYYLNSLANGHDTTLLYTDVFFNQNQKSHDPRITNKSQDFEGEVKSVEDPQTDYFNFDSKEMIFDCKPLVDINQNSKQWNKRLFDSNFDDRQEKLQLERKRIMLTGLTSYEYHEPSKRFVFACDGYLFYFDDIGQPPYVPIRLETSIKFAKINPVICPTNSDIIAYVSDGDIWLINVKSRNEIRLTSTKYNHDRQILSAGLPSYVIQEEFRRYNGFWWRPGYSTLKSSSGSTVLEYHILYEEVDETNVELLSLCASSGSIEKIHYPRTERENARSTLKLVGFKCDLSTNLLFDARCSAFSASCSLYSIFPDFEYLVRCDWYSRDAVWVQLLDRPQKVLVLALVTLNDSFAPQILLREEMNSYWVTVNDIPPLFINSGQDIDNTLKPKSEIQFLWLSEKTGFRHIYYIKVKIADGRFNGSLKTNFDYSNENLNELKCEESLLIEKKQLTKGNWEVSNRFVWLDQNNRLVYFVGLKDSPIEKQLYSLSLDDESLSVERLTSLGYSHSLIAFDSTMSLFVNIKSNLSNPSLGYINRKISQDTANATKYSQLCDNSTKCSFQKLGLIFNNNIQNQNNKTSSLSSLSSLSSSCLSSQNEDEDFWSDLTTPEIFTYRLKESNELVYGLIFKPPVIESGVKYPCVLDIYGGPEVQVVSNSFKDVRYARRHLLSSQSYVVCAFDCRGSHHRGIKFESHIQGRLGQVEVADQVEVLQWLANSTGYIDMSRIAIHGWSYGGYLSLMALVQRPDIFKIAIAGAPVVDWTLYDTGYTERYMSIPSKNPKGYEKSSVLSWIKSFPDEENRLLLLHGMMDENVHFIHSQTLIQALIKAGKPHHLQIYPSERHSLRKSPSGKHYEAVLVSFLQQHL